MLTVSVAIHNPDKVRWEGFVRTVTQNTPELTQLIVVDNASSDENKIMTEEILNKYSPPKLLILHNKENVGFGKAHNVALPLVVNPFLAVVNDDVEFTSVWSTSMLQKFDNPNVGQVSVKPGQCNTIKEDGGGLYLDTLETPEYCEGSLFIIRTEAAREVGLFDNIYAPAYFEDSDLSLRLRQLGWELACVRINWVHYAHETSDRVGADALNAVKLRNQKIFVERWKDYLKTKSLD